VPGPGLFEFEVLDADPRRFKRIRITPLKERRDRQREPRRPGVADALAGAPAPSSSDVTPPKDAGSAAGTRSS